MSATDETVTPNRRPTAALRPTVATMAALGVGLLLLNPCLSASAQAPGPAAMEIRYEQWGIQQGAPEHINALAQTADGYLWIGGTTGLFRFDGMRFERFRASGGDALLSTNISALFTPASGGLWVGHHFGGFSFVQNGRVTNYGGETAVATGTITQFAESPDKDLWAVTPIGLFRFEHAEWRLQRTAWASPVTGDNHIGFDRGGVLWLLSNRTLYYLLPGAQQFKELNRDLDVSATFVQDGRGTVLTGPYGGHEELRASPILRSGRFQLLDNDNGLWTWTPRSKSLTRTETAGRLEGAGDKSPTESYDLKTPGNRARLVDREGNVWFADDTLLYRFYYSSLKKLRLPIDAGTFAVAPREDGGVWIGSSATPEIFSVADGKAEPVRPPASELGWVHISTAPDKTVWFGGQRALWRFVDGRFIRTELPAEIADQAAYLQAITPDRSGALWFSFGPRGLYRLARGVWTPFGGRKDMPRSGVISEFTDRGGRVWFGYTTNQLAMLDGDRLRLFGTKDGIRVGNITAIHGRGSAVWIGGERGLQQFDDGRFHDINAVNDDWLRGVSGIVETAGGDLWLNGIAGILHIGQAEIAKGLQDSHYRVRAEHRGNRDGVPGFATQIRPLPTAIEGADGRLWFALTQGVMWIDPADPPKKAPPPPIAIQSITADGRNYRPGSPLELPAHTSNVSINYSAVSLADPESIRIRYQLREADAAWQEASSASIATYRNLSPGDYSFHVAASDTDGVWLDQNVASVAFTILPAWYQTWVFRGACAAAGVMILLGLYRYRLLQLAHEFDLRLEERLSERTRFARELHDTLLQTVLASQLVSQQALQHPDDAARLAGSMRKVHAWLSESVEAGRAALNSLRTSTEKHIDLAVVFRNAASECVSPDGPEVELTVLGERRYLHPLVHDEVSRIGCEAIRNASLHSSASKLEIELDYRRDLCVRIQDNGVGIEAPILAEGRPGHFGLIGMRERSDRITADLRVSSTLGAGTSITLRVPARVAFVAPSQSSTVA